MSEQELPPEAEVQAPRHQEPMSALPELQRVRRLLESGQEVIQVGTGVLLFCGAALALGYTVFHFIEQLGTATLTLAFPNETVHLTAEQNLATAIINLISDLLLVLIIAEIFNTILHFLREKTVYLKPFLFIGIISAARDVLATTARITFFEMQEKEFTELLVELGVSLAVILGLSLALRIIRKEDASDPL